MAPPLLSPLPPPRVAASVGALSKLSFNVDAVAIAVALLLAALVRLNLLPRIGW